MTRERNKSLMSEVSAAYHESEQRHRQYRDRGQHDKADDYLDEMKLIESCVQIHEVSPEWRKQVAARKARERRR